MKRLSALSHHPFAVEAFFRRSLVLTYALPASALSGLIHPGLTLDTYDDWGFVAIALVQTQGLRPARFPTWLGRDFFLSGYRIFTRFERPNYPKLRGLCILRSDTDRRMMSVLGNIFTRYNYSRARIQTRADEKTFELRVETPGHEADLELTADLTSRPAPLPEGSPFRSLGDARLFAGPLPYTFSYDAEQKKMVVIKGLREAWDPQPVRVDVRRVTFFDRPPFVGTQPRLANAFYVENIPYRWKAGRLEGLT